MCVFSICAHFLLELLVNYSYQSKCLQVFIWKACLLCQDATKPVINFLFLFIFKPKWVNFSLKISLYISVCWNLFLYEKHHHSAALRIVITWFGIIPKASCPVDNVRYPRHTYISLHGSNTGLQHGDTQADKLTTRLRRQSRFDIWGNGCTYSCKVPLFPVSCNFITTHLCIICVYIHATTILKCSGNTKLFVNEHETLLPTTTLSITVL